MKEGVKYTRFKWTHANYLMQGIYLVGGRRRWIIYERVPEGTEIVHNKEIAYFDNEAEAYAKWKALTGETL